MTYAAERFVHRPTVLARPSPVLPNCLFAYTVVEV